VRLSDKKIALFVADIFEDLEFWYPNYRMREEGAEIVVVGPTRDSYAGKKGLSASADQAISAVKADEFHALIIPGGYAPDHMRRVPEMIQFVKEMHEEDKPVAAICHAGWMLASAGILEGKRVTSFFAIKDDLVNAGAEWVDQEVVVDDKIITSRKPDDLPAFCRAIIDSLSKADA
jgi:protease I